MSKAYGLAGRRVGWLVCKDRGTLVRFERYKHFLSICNSAPSEDLALKAREHLLERNRRIVRDNVAEYAHVFGEFRELFDWKAPDGGCVTFIPYRGSEGVEEFTRRAVEEAGVLFLPASIFRSALSKVPTDRFRVGVGRLHVPEGLAVLRTWLKTNSP
jgi:aspartate/methionine/tyrosine aminotransferase